MSARSSEQLVSKKYQALIEQETAIVKAFPALYNFLERNSGDFRGLSVVIGRDGGYLVILKRFGDDGGEEVTFGNSLTPYEAFAAMEATLARGKWKLDTPYSKAAS